MSLTDSKGVTRLLAYVATAAGTRTANYALRVQKAARDAGIPCEASLVPRALSKQMEDAGRIGAAWTIIVGEKEIKARGVTLRNMEDGKEEALGLEEAIGRILHA
jgi:histidyl-tRNA synthetase